LVSGRPRFVFFKSINRNITSKGYSFLAQYDETTVIGKVKTKNKKGDVVADPPIDADVLTNSGFEQRFNLFKEGKKVVSMAKLHYPLAKKALCLPPGISMRISFRLNPHNWIILTDHPGIRIFFDNRDSYYIILLFFFLEDKLIYKLDDVYLTAKLRVPTIEGIIIYYTFAIA